MFFKNKEIYKIGIEQLSENCIEFIGFTYKKVGNGNITFGYVDCSGESQTINVFVSDSSIAHSEQELLTPICVRENSVYKITGGNILNIYYGISC